MKYCCRAWEPSGLILFTSKLHLCPNSAMPAQFCFGKAVRQIVEGETRFSKIGAIGEGASRAELAALDLRQLFLAMTEEVRIIIVKLADRLHNMRTLGSMPAHKQKKIADETLLVRSSLHRSASVAALCLMSTPWCHVSVEITPACCRMAQDAVSVAVFLGTSDRGRAAAGVCAAGSPARPV